MQRQISEAQNKTLLLQELRVKQAAKQAARQQIEEERNVRLKALQAMAGNVSSTGGSEPATTGAGAGGNASSSYGDKVRRRVLPNIVFAGDAAPNISALVAIDCAPDGHVLNARIVRTSGNPGWDASALRAVQKSDPMPLDDNGTAPAHFTITFRPRANWTPRSGDAKMARPARSIG
jgi:colicin import membrane protein